VPSALEGIDWRRFDAAANGVGVRDAFQEQSRRVGDGDCQVPERPDCESANVVSNAEEIFLAKRVYAQTRALTTAQA